MSGIPIPKHEGSVEVGPNPPPAGQARPRRGLNFPDHLVTQPIPGIETVYDILLYAARTHGNKRAIGYRDIEKIIEEETEVKKVVGGKEVKEKKTWKYFQLSPFKYLSYIEFKDKVHLVSKALIKHGVARGQVFNVYATTSPNWQLVAHACMAIGNPIATAYDTLGEEGLTHSLSQPDCVGVFTNADLLPTLFKVLEKTPTIRLVVYDGEAKAEVVDKIKGARDGAIEVVHIDAFIKTGQEATDITIEDRAPKSDETSCIMYTSGTTGTPKGVVLTHANLIASVGAVHHLVGPYLRSSDTFLAFLPLAHILEYIVELLMLFFGITNGYGKIRTLTDTNVRNSLGDLRAFQPSIMVGVPAVWETIRKGILGKVAQASSIRQSIFNIAFTMKKNNVPGLKQVADSVVFSQIKDQTGGKLRLALSGGAALSKETQEFLNLALVTLVGGASYYPDADAHILTRKCNVGYGMTESCG
jgi:long-chain acyl-CoA synthetase